MKIPYVRPSIGTREIQLAAAAVRDGWGKNQNYYVQEFEKKFSEKIDAEVCIATSSCTGAIELALAAIGASHGDEIILADTNWIATLAPIIHRGCNPIIVDILEDSWCIDPTKVERAITKKTKAIIATHLYGNLCELKSLQALADNHNLYLIEDSAEAIGSYYEGRHAGTIGDIGVFSFHGSKTITTGEGGMLVTRSVEIENRVRMLNNHGRSPSEERQFFPSEIGYKFKMTDVQAAIGIAQLERFDELVSKKRHILNRYREQLASCNHISMNPIQLGCETGAWMPNITFCKESGITREKLLEVFRKAQIDARVFFWPLTTLGILKTQQSVRNPVAYSVASRSINLPSYHEMTDRDIEEVVEVIKSLE